jgi:hypothetical protein
MNVRNFLLQKNRTPYGHILKHELSDFTFGQIVENINFVTLTLSQIVENINYTRSSRKV